MQSTAFLSRPRHALDETSPCEPEIFAEQFAAGDHVRVAGGPLAGLCGVLYQRAEQSRWFIASGDLAPGVLICLESRLLAPR